MRYLHLIFGLTLASLSISPLRARAEGTGWTQKSILNNVVNKHEFDHISLASMDCSVSIKLHFDAPEEAYKLPGGPVRNRYYFRARVKFADGKKIDTGLFKTSKPGKKLYSYVHDTSGEGCWAKTPQKMSTVDVIGCRGGGCQVPDFE